MKLFRIPSLKTNIIGIIVTYAIMIYIQDINIVSILASIFNILFTVLFSLNIVFIIKRFFNKKIEIYNEKLKQKRNQFLWGDE